MTRYILHILLAVTVLACAGCCRPHADTLTRHADTIRVDRWHYDSIDRWHTVTTSRRGDTITQIDSVIIDRWHVRWRDSVRLIRDTVSRTITQAVERPRTLWEGIRLSLFWPLIIVAAVAIILLLFLNIRR